MAKNEPKIDQLVKEVAQINTHLAVYNAHLEEHMRRSDLLEESVNLLRASVNGIRSFQDRVIGGLKLIGSSAALTLLLKVLSGLF